MALALILVPLLAAALAAALPSNRWRPWLLPAGALAHLALVLAALRGPEVSALGGWLVLDPLGKVLLVLVSVLFFLCALYAPGYLALRPERPNRVFCANLFVVLGMMTLVILSHDLGLMWVAMEATTLASRLAWRTEPQNLQVRPPLSLPGGTSRKSMEDERRAEYEPGVGGIAESWHQLGMQHTID